MTTLLANEHELARIDPLTTVPNRRAFYETFDKERTGSRHYLRPFTIAYVDLDNFEKVNDSLGHAMGDELLVRVAEGLRTNLRATDYVGRLGGMSSPFSCRRLTRRPQACCSANFACDSSKR